MPALCRPWLWLVLTACLLAGCTSVPRSSVAERAEAATWSGRLSLRVDGQPANSFSAGFDLKGNAEAGTLLLQGPLGAALAQLAWTPQGARLLTNGTQRDFDSLDALVKEATGAEIPVRSMFRWLAGEDARVGGWAADLAELGNGRLVARRVAPLPALELRVVLD